MLLFVDESGPDRRDGQPTEQSGGSAVLFVASTVVVILAALVRVWAATGDFWLDEIWSLLRVLELSSPTEILTEIHHDNNHILNSFYLYLLGRKDNWILYRIPAVVAGTLTVIMAGVIARRWGRLEAFTAVLLTGSSYLMIHYSSEARGYGPVLLFALLSFDLMQRYLQGRRWAAPLFCAAVMLGFLAHLTFIHVYAALVLWSVVQFVRARRCGDVVIDVICCHLAPVVFLIGLYYFDVRHLRLGGGPITSASELIRTAALSVGAPDRGAWAVAAAGVVGLVVVVSLIQLVRERSNLWLFFVMVILASPAALLLAKASKFVYVRYFLVSVVFFLLLLSHLLGRLYQRGLAGRAAYIVIVLLVLAGATVHTADLLTYGRGQYLDAVKYMLANTPGPVMTIASDHDFRNRMVLAYYLPRFAGTKRIAYYNVGAWSSAEPPHWFIRHSVNPPREPPPSMRDPFGHAYELETRYRTGKLSGLHWYVYRRVK